MYARCIIYGLWRDWVAEFHFDSPFCQTGRRVNVFHISLLIFQEKKRYGLDNFF